MDKREIVRRLRVFNVFIYILAYPSVLYATESFDSQKGSSALYGYFYIGDNIGGSNSNKLDSVNYKGGGPPEWGFGIGRYLNEFVSIEGTFEYWGERYKRKNSAVIPGTENNVIQAGGLGLSISAVYNYHLKDFHGYLGAGAGYFLTGILVTKPGSGLLTEEGAPSDKLLPGFHVMIGGDYRIKENHKLGLEIKHRILEADFGEYTNGKVDVGGICLLLIYRHSSM